MATEDFTTFTTHDPNSDFTITASKINVVNMIRTVHAWNGKDYGADYFGGGDFEIRFKAHYTPYDPYGCMHLFLVADTDSDYIPIKDGGGNALSFSMESSPSPYASIHWQLRALEGGSEATDSWYEASGSLDRYIKFKLDRDGGGGGYGQIIAEIRSGSHSGTLLATLTVDLTASPSTYRYGIATSSQYYSPDWGWNMSGYIEDLEFISIGAGFTATISDQAPVPQDSISTERTIVKTATISDQAPVPQDSISAALATHTGITIADVAPVPQDSISVELNKSWDITISDVAPVPEDSISAGKILLEGPGRWVAPLKITPIGSSIAEFYLAAHPVRHPTIYFAPKILDYGIFKRSIAAPPEFIRSGDVTIKVADSDNSLRQSLAPKTIKKALAELRLGPEGGKYSAFLRPYRREVAHVTQPADGELNLQLRDRAFSFLEREIPRVINEENFPNLPEGSDGLFANIIIGQVHSDEGAIPCPLVDPDNYWYLVMRNVAKSVDAVYRKADDSDDFEIVPSSEYTIKTDYYLEHELTSGDYCTLIVFNSDQEGKQIRANVSGVKDSAGDLAMTNFAECIEGMLLYLAWAHDRSDMLNIASIEETKVLVEDLICAGAWTKPITFGEALTQLQRSSNIDVFADKNDRIALRWTADDEAPSVNISDLLRLHNGSVSQEIGNPTYNQLPYKYKPNYAANTWTHDTFDNEEDQDAIGEPIRDEELAMFFVRDSATAQSVIEHRAQWLDLNCFRFRGKMPLIPALEDLELADIVAIDHFGGIKSGGYIAEQFKITELGMDINELIYEFAGIRRRLPPPDLVETEYDGDGQGGDAGSGTLDDDGDAITDRTGIDRGWAATNSRIGPFSNDIEGELFGVFRDYSNAKKLCAWLTSNYGYSWANRDQANQPTLTNDIASFDCCAYSGAIHCLTQEDVTGRVAYHVFNMSTKAWTTIDEEITSGVASGDSFCVSIDLRYPGGEPVAYFQGDSELDTGKYYSRGYYSIKSGGSWSSPVMITPNPGDYAENQPGYPYAAQKDSSHCIIQRVIAGRENRMHFFYYVVPAVVWVQGSPDEYANTLSGELAQSGRQFLDMTSIYNASGRNMGNFVNFSSRSKIALTRRVGWATPAIDVYAEGETLSKLRQVSLGSSLCWPGDTWTYNPTVKVGLDADDETLYALIDSAATYYTEHKSSADEGASWAAGQRAGPDYYPGGGDPFPLYLQVRGRMYLAYFSIVGGFPTFRWIKLSSLPYS